MCCIQQFESVDTANLTLSFTVTDEKVDVSGEWSKEKLLILLKNKLIANYEKCDINEENRNKILDNIISHGIYNEAVITKVLKNGISKDSIVKAMKCGLQSLECNEINAFCNFNITNETNLTCKVLLLNTVDKELFAKLNNIGFGEKESLDVIIKGLINQNDCCLFQLTLSGILTSKILNWQGPIVEASEDILKFLQKLDIDDETLLLVKEKGLSQEIKEILYDLGYSESNEVERVCICDVNIEEEIKGVCFVERISLFDEISEHEQSFTQSSDDSDQEIRDFQENKVLESKNYLRQNLMVPLTWAMSRALKYNPSDPIHYIACQLIRWKNNSVDPIEMNETLDFVIDATTKRDRILVEEKKRKEKSTVKTKDIACQHCLEQMELHRIKECCWKCTKKWEPKPSCQFPELCSFCKLSASRISETTSLDRFKMSKSKTIPNLSKEAYNEYKTYSHDCLEY